MRELVEGMIREPWLIAAEMDRAAKDGNAELIESELKDVSKDLKAAQKKLSKYQDAYMEAESKTLRKMAGDKVAEVEQEITSLVGREKTLNERLMPYKNLDGARREVMSLVEKFAEKLDEPDYLTPEHKRLLLDGLGITVHAYQGKFKVHMTPPIVLPALSNQDPSVVHLNSITRRRWKAS